MVGTLHELGAFCASTYDGEFEKYIGDIEGFSKFLEQGNTVTRSRGVITVASAERTDCTCQFSSSRNNTPGIVCNCSAGWQQHAWTIVLQRKPQVDVKESILQGGKRCVFEIRTVEDA